MKRQAITLGRVGILLPIASIIPFLGIVAGLAAMILLLISQYNFSRVYEKPEIFKKALTGTIVVVAGNVLGGIFVTIGLGTAIFTSSEAGGLDAIDNYQQIASQIFGSGMSIFGAIIMFAAAIIGIYFIFKSLQALAEQSNITMFKTAGLLYLIGTVASIILIGGLVVFVGWILHIIAYFSIQAEEGTAAT